MAKRSRSWSKPDGIENLIGIKKVDYSTFVYGIHIPMTFRQDILLANNGIDVELGTYSLSIYMYS